MRVDLHSGTLLQGVDAVRLVHIPTSVWAMMLSWYELKHFIERSVAFSSDSLHVLAGVLIQLGCARLLRRPVSHWLPWLMVLVLIALNETIDLVMEHWPDRGMQYGESARDFLLTLVLPTVLLSTVRLAPQLFISASDSKGTRPRSGRGSGS